MKTLLSLATVAAIAALPLPGASSTALAGTWTALDENMATIVMGIDFLDTEVGYVAGGDNGLGPIVYRTPDGGRTWIQQVEGMPSATYMDISMGDETHGLAGGLGMFYMFAGASYTANGRDWEASRDRYLASAYQDVEAVDSQNMFLIGMWAKMAWYGEGVAASRDGGRTFDYFDWGIDTSPRYGSFISPMIGYVAGGQWPYDTARFGSGDYRVNKHLALPMANTLSREDDFDGYRCVIAKTINGGVEWDILYDDYDRFYCNGIEFVDERNGWVVGEGPDGAWILHTNDAGRTWEEQHFEANGSLLAVRMLDRYEGWAAGASIQRGFESLLLHTIDGGMTWDKLDTNQSYYIFNLDAVDPDHLWAVAFGASGACSVLQYTP